MMKGLHGNKSTFFVFFILVISGLLCCGEASGYPSRLEYIQNYLSQFNIVEYRVKPGDTLWKIFKKLNLLEDNIELVQNNKHLRHLKPGELLELYVAVDDGHIDKIRRNINGETYVLRRYGSEWDYYKLEWPVVVLKEVVSGRIEDNLYNSILRLGLSPSVVFDLSDIFSSDIDFNTDFRQGDTFILYIEKFARNGKICKPPHILAARLIVQGKTYEAYYFETKKEHGSYYDRYGHSKEKMFLKAPLHYRRISSFFSPRRLHPILKIYRPHYGIDYAAPVGTPVSALGDGVVKFVGWKGGFGKFIAIKHNRIYKTTYGHLSRFARGIRVGVRVKKGQVIGYVGATGLATGPHLDFRFYKNGKPINFLKTRWPHAHSIPKRLMGKYRKLQLQYASILDSEQEKLLARLGR